MSLRESDDLLCRLSSEAQRRTAEEEEEAQMPSTLSTMTPLRGWNSTTFIRCPAADAEGPFAML
jgi:hypothetical protein